MKCATIGCRSRATHMVDYRFLEDDALEPMCEDCLQAYSRRPAFILIAKTPIKVKAKP